MTLRRRGCPLSDDVAVFVMPETPTALSGIVSVEIAVSPLPA
jgi:hypothetical protein